VGNLQIDTNNVITRFLVIPKGVGTGYFSLKKFKYFISIPQKKKELFIAECNYWISRLDNLQQI